MLEGDPDLLDAVVEMLDSLSELEKRMDVACELPEGAHRSLKATRLCLGNLYRVLAGLSQQEDEAEGKE